MMERSRLSKTCQACPYVDTCDHKEMELHGYLSGPNKVSVTVADLSQPMAQPMVRETIEIHRYGQTFVRYKDDIEKELNKALYKDLYLGLRDC